MQPGLMARHGRASGASNVANATSKKELASYTVPQFPNFNIYWDFVPGLAEILGLFAKLTFNSVHGYGKLGTRFRTVRQSHS